MLTEDDVVRAVADHLRSDGWTVVQSLTTNDRGVDIVATQHDGSTLHVEAKGGTSSKVRTARHGRPFDRSQVRDHVAKAVLTALEGIARRDDILSAIAVPDDPLHREFVGRVAYPLDVLGVITFFVDDAGHVREGGGGRQPD
jgi:hypothetical protein